MPYVRSFAAVFSNPGRRNFLYHERQKKNARPGGQNHPLALVHDAMRGQIRSKCKPGPVHHGQVGKIEQPLVVLPRFKILVHIRAQDEDDLGSSMCLMQQFQCLDRVPLLMCIHLYSRRAIVTKGRDGERDHGKTMERGHGIVKLLVGSGIGWNEMDLVGLERRGDGSGSSEVAVMNRIESSAQNSDPHDSPVTLEESLPIMRCFNPSSPSPVTDEILISSI